jgi:hypothetical protein
MKGDAEMAFEPKVNQAGLFPNTVDPDKSDFNGQIQVECANCGRVTAFWINGWRKVTKTGGKYLSLALRLKGTAGANGQSRQPAADTDPF